MFGGKWGNAGRYSRWSSGWVLNKFKRYTVLLVPQTGGPMKKLSFTEGRLKFWMGALLTVGALLLANLAVFVYLYMIDRGNVFQYLTFKSENTKLKSERKTEMAELKTRLEGVSDEHQQTIARMAEIETITGFRNFDPKEFLSAQGGPSKTQPESAGAMTFESLRENIQSIDHEHRSMEERLQKIQLFVRANEERMRHTPVGWPVNGWVSSVFGWRRDPWTGKSEHHDGVDVSAWYGTPIRATADGVVRVSGRSGGFGQVVVLTHNYGYETYYGHMSRLAVKPKDKISRGDVIGYVGSSGRSTGAHAHYEIRVNNRPVDPWAYLGLMP